MKKSEKTNVKQILCLFTAVYALEMMIAFIRNFFLPTGETIFTKEFFLLALLFPAFICIGGLALIDSTKDSDNPQR